MPEWSGTQPKKIKEDFLSVKEQFNRKVLTLLACFFFVAQALSSIAVPKTLYDIGLAYNLSGTQKGNLVSVVGLGFIVAALLGGYFSETLGKKKVLLIGLGSAAAGNALFATVSFFASAYFLVSGFSFLFLIGAGKGILEGVTNTLIIHLQPERKSFFLNLAHAFYAVGAVTGPIIGGYLIMMRGWPSLYYFNALVNTGLFVLLATQKYPSFREKTLINWPRMKNLAQSEVFILLNLAMILYVGAEVGLVTWIAEYFRTNTNFLLSQMQSGLIISYFWVAMLIGRFLYGPLVERISAGPALSISCLGGMASILILILTNNLGLALGMVALSGLFLSGIPATIYAIAGERFPYFLGIVIGAMAAGAGIGSTIFPNLIGRISDIPSLGLKTGIGTAALYLVGIFLIVIRLSHIRKETVGQRPQ